MKFLADMGISPRSAVFLRGLGHDAIHLHDEGLDRLSDANIIAKARTEGRIVLTSDLDLGELVATSKAQLPVSSRSGCAISQTITSTRYSGSSSPTTRNAWRRGRDQCAERQVRVRSLPITQV